MTARVAMIRREKLKFEPREASERLRTSLEKYGMLEPIYVRPISMDEYEVLDGRKRLAVLIGPLVQCLILPMTTECKAELSGWQDVPDLPDGGYLPFTWEDRDDYVYYDVTFQADFGVFKKGETFHGLTEEGNSLILHDKYGKELRRQRFVGVPISQKGKNQG